jgi:hypothetical protein
LPICESAFNLPKNGAIKDYASVSAVHHQVTEEIFYPAVKAAPRPRADSKRIEYKDLRKSWIGPDRTCYLMVKHLPRSRVI